MQRDVQRPARPRRRHQQRRLRIPAGLTAGPQVVKRWQGREYRRIHDATVKIDVVRDRACVAGVVALFSDSSRVHFQGAHITKLDHERRRTLEILRRDENVIVAARTQVSSRVERSVRCALEHEHPKASGDEGDDDRGECCGSCHFYRGGAANHVLETLPLGRRQGRPALE